MRDHARSIRTIALQSYREFASWQSVGPALLGVQHPQDLQFTTAHTISHQIGTLDDQLSRTWNAPCPADIELRILS